MLKAVRRLLLILHREHAQASYAIMAFSSIHCECYTQSFGINNAAVYYCDLSSCSPVVPVKAVLPVRVDSAEIHHSREAGKVHLGIALSFGRAAKNMRRGSGIIVLSHDAFTSVLSQKLSCSSCQQVSTCSID